MKNVLMPATRSFGNAGKGAILVTDISGFSRFVQRVDQSVGVTVISRLLRVLIESNQLNLEISEIEGDAILFYRFGEAPSAIAIKAQFELMLTAFSNEVARIAASVPEAASLSVKMVVTYGELVSFSLAGFEKLYGEAVIKAHRLLKNHIGAHTYVLIAEEIFMQQEIKKHQPAGLLKKCDVYDLGPVCYRYISYPARLSANVAGLSARDQNRHSHQRTLADGALCTAE